MGGPCTNMSQAAPSSTLPGFARPPPPSSFSAWPQIRPPSTSPDLNSTLCFLYCMNTRCNFYCPICFYFHQPSVVFFLHPKCHLFLLTFTLLLGLSFWPRASPECILPVSWLHYSAEIWWCPGPLMLMNSSLLLSLQVVIWFCFNLSLTGWLMQWISQDSEMQVVDIPTQCSLNTMMGIFLACVTGTSKVSLTQAQLDPRV